MHTGFLPPLPHTHTTEKLRKEHSRMLNLTAGVSPVLRTLSPLQSTPQARTPAEPDSIYEKGPELEAFQICYSRQPSKPRFPTGFLSLMANSCFILHYFPALCHTPAAR